MVHPHTPVTTVPEMAAPPIEPPEIQPPTPGNPTEPPPEEPPGNPRPEVPPPVREPGEPALPDSLPGRTPDEFPVRGPNNPTTPNPAVTDRRRALVLKPRCPNLSVPINGDEQIRRSSVLSAAAYIGRRCAMRNLPCARNARNSTRRLSTTESYPNQPPTNQQSIGSKNSLGSFTSRRSLCTPGQQNQKSKAASVGSLAASTLGTGPL